jgi:hypothetical protein
MHAEYGTKDIIVGLIPYEERYIPEAIDLCGEFKYASYPGFNDVKDKGLHYSSAAVLNKMWRWRTNGVARDYFMEFRNQTGIYGRKWTTNEPMNSVCWRGFGHFANYVGPGFRAKRGGALETWTPYDFSMQQT